jgi:hypothetical protein
VGGASRAIWGLSPDDYWLAGNGSTGGPIHYDGAQWSQVASGNVHFVAVHGVSPTDVWFAGFGERVAYWNGTTLTTIRSGPTNVAYRGVWAANTQNVWAVGGQRFDHWDGQTWTDHQINLGKQSYFEGIDGVAADDIWVVGDAYPGAGIIFHFDGTQWTQSISGAGNSLADVWMASSNDVWAVGLAGSVLRRVSP